MEGVGRVLSIVTSKASVHGEVVGLCVVVMYLRKDICLHNFNIYTYTIGRLLKAIAT